MKRFMQGMGGVTAIAGLLLAFVAVAFTGLARAQDAANTATNTMELAQPTGQGAGDSEGRPVSVRVKKSGIPRKAQAPQVVADLSTHTVAIKADFAGTRVMLFGALVGSREESKTRPDLIVVVRGPSRVFKMHRKRRVGPIWINSDERIFRAAPGYYALLSSRPLAEIAPADKLQKRGIGFGALKAHLLATGEGFKSLEETNEYADALVRLLRRKGLYRTNDEGVRFTGRYLFRATFDLPANVPLGEYEADVYLWRDGRLLGKFSSALEIEKRGFERFVYEVAHKRPLFYGVAAVIIAIAAGFAAAAVFRKD